MPKFSIIFLLQNCEYRLIKLIKKKLYKKVQRFSALMKERN